MPEYGEDTDVLDALHGEPSSDQSYVTAMSHFYRGEIGRMMVWRQRLDHLGNHLYRHNFYRRIFV